MYELKKIGKVFTSKSVGTGPSSYKKRIYRTAVLQRLRSTGIQHIRATVLFAHPLSVVFFHPSSRASLKSFNIDDPTAK